MSIKLFRRGPSVKQEPRPAFYKIQKKTEMAEVSPNTDGAVHQEKPMSEKKVDFGKVVVYTCITGGYDELRKPFKTDGVDYICFTDNMTMAANGWELRPIPEKFEGLTDAKIQRMVKILPHKYLRQYDISVYVDGSIEVKADVIEFIKSVYDEKFSVFIPKHPTRSCIYEEYKAVKAIGKDKTDLPDKQMKKYLEEKYPVKNGLTQNNIILRKHNDPECIKLMETWAEEVKNFSHRDQLSLFYSIWKNKTNCLKQLDKKTCNSKYFHWNTKHGKIVKGTKKKMIDWKKHFDHIYCIHYLPYKNRFKKCQSEFERVGIRDSGVFSWRLTWDSPIFEKLYQVCNAAPSVGCMKVGFAHYQCIKEAYELGFKHVLILENDNIFLKDLDKLEKILDDIPGDYDILFLDKIPAVSARYEEAIEKDKVNDSFIDIEKKFYVLANCYALSRKGMKHVIDCQERRLAISDTYLRFNTNAPEPEDLKRYAAIKTIAIQNPDFAAESENEKLRKEHAGINSNIDDYKRIGVKFEDYNQ